MAHVERPSYTRTVPPGAKVVGETVTWTGRHGKPVRGELINPERVRVVVPGRWVGVYRDHRGAKRKTRTYSSRSTALEAALIQERHAIEVREGRAKADQPSGTVHLGDHVEAYANYLACKGDTEIHVQRCQELLEYLLDAMGLGSPALVDCERVQQWLERTKRIGNERTKGKPFAQRWLTTRVGLLKSYGKWLHKKRIVAANPFDGLTAADHRGERRRIRRALPQEQLQRLLDTTRESNRTHRGLNGPARATLYALASYTGLRCNALRKLTRASLVWVDGLPVAVHSEAAAQKNRRGHSVPLHESLRGRLSELAANLGEGEPLFPGTWNERASEMLGLDLAEAGIPREAPAGVFDFHSLRLQFGYLLASSGVPLVAAQQLLDHSTPILTANIYSQFGGELAGEIGKLKGLA